MPRILDLREESWGPELLGLREEARVRLQGLGEEGSGSGILGLREERWGLERHQKRES